MDVSTIAVWIPAATFALTGVGVIVRLSAYITRLDELLGGHDRRIRKLEKSKKRDAKRLRKAARSVLQ